MFVFVFLLFIINFFIIFLQLPMVIVFLYSIVFYFIVFI
nr:MAG TPA: hypothetical protein [Caudoviricetes sp.]